MARLLIVEVNLNQQALYTQELTDDGYEVVCAANGSEALQDFKQKLPDLVIIDILLPCMPVIEVMDRMLDAKPDLPIIVHSAFSFPWLEQTVEMARAYVVKSGNLDVLKHRIRTELATPKIANHLVS